MRPAALDAAVRDVPNKRSETNKRSAREKDYGETADEPHEEDTEDHEEEAGGEDVVDEDHDETNDGEEDDEDDPVAMLIAQGVSEALAKSALARSNGNLDAAVMLVVHQLQLDKEEKEMAKVMEESLREAEEQAAKRDEEESKRKTTSPAAFFQGSAFLEHLGEDVAAALLSDDSPAKADVIATLEFERKCKRWYRNSSREVDQIFAAVAAEIVPRVAVKADGDAGTSAGPSLKKRRPDAGTETDGAEPAEPRGDVGGGGGGGGGGVNVPGIEMAHSVLVAHLTELREAVLAMPEKSGGVPDVFSPRKDAPFEQIDLTAD